MGEGEKVETEADYIFILRIDCKEVICASTPFSKQYSITIRASHFTAVVSFLYLALTMSNPCHPII